MGYNIISAAEAASLIKNGETIGLSGFPRRHAESRHS